MKTRTKPALRGYAEPVLRGQPLFIRLCEALVENLALILRTALVLGGLMLAHELHELRDVFVRADPEAEPAVSSTQEKTRSPDPAMLEEPWLTDGVQHALNCTHADYRNKHYDECVQDPSAVYPKPGVESDDIGFIHYRDPVLYAGLAPLVGADSRDPL